jgi:dolichyl-phosphate-mannose-protein mannosyltransferase
LISSRERRNTRSLLATWGWGLVAAILAAIVYWPWFRFVESHGGYAALLTHHRSYLGGFASWPGHLRIQLAEARVLSGGLGWRMIGCLAAASGTWKTQGWSRDPRRLPRILLHFVFISMICATELLGLVFVILFLCTTANSFKNMAITPIHVLGGWLVLLFLTPFYHPYARLWLPIEAFGWLRRAGLGKPQPVAEVITRRPPDPLVAVAVICSFAFCFGVVPNYWTSEDRIATLFAPTDSLRRACRTLASELPKELDGLRVYARPPVTFYLSTTATIYTQPNLDRVLAPSDARTWALLDMVMVRQQAGASARLAELLERWDVVREEPTTLNLPTLLDIDPASATSGAGDRSATLRLLRPKRPGEVR